MRQAPLDVGLTFKVLGSITPGNHIKDYRLKSQFNGRSFLPYLQPPLHGATNGRESASSSIVTTRLLC